jgi:hypothetical protein
MKIQKKLLKKKIKNLMWLLLIKIKKYKYSKKILNSKILFKNQININT